MTPAQPPQISADEVQALCRDEALYERTERLWQQGAVESPVWRGPLLLGNVRGSEPEPYAASVEALLLDRKKWAWRCTCPYFEIYGGPCKHTLALLLQWATDPGSFAVEASLDESLAGERRAEWLALVREALHDSPELRRLLALEPEPKKPLNRPLNLAPFDEQLRYAVRHHAGNPYLQRDLFTGVLETAAGYLRVGDAANAARLATLLTSTLLALPKRPAPLARLLRQALLLLEAATLEAAWEPEEQRAWLDRVMTWWEDAEPAIADRLLDVVLRCYRSADEPRVENWLRGLLRRPVHANRLSGSLWRQRVLAFLLAYYEAAGKWTFYLDLCWEEGEDARAARRLVESGDIKPVLGLARQGLRSCNAHREVASALLDAGEEEAAHAVAEEGLRYHDTGRGALLSWLAARALENGDVPRALSRAREAWEQGPSLERYRLLRDAARRAEVWTDLARNLHASLEHQGELALLVEILADEEAWQSAAALLPATGARREELTEMVARGSGGSAPAEAVNLFFELADLRVAGRSRASYARAAQALRAAQNIADATGNEKRFAARLHAFMESYPRRPALRDEMIKQGIVEEQAVEQRQ
jgi:hypothetical protein